MSDPSQQVSEHITKIPGTNSGTVLGVSTVEDKLARMRANPKGVRYSDLIAVCEHHFGTGRSTGGTHTVFKTPWPGDPRVNIQDDNGEAKRYQVVQVLKAIDKLIGNEPPTNELTRED